MVKVMFRSFMHRSRYAARLTACAAIVLFLVAAAAANGRKFYDDDPIAREPETQDAAKAEEYDISLLADLTLSLFTDRGERAATPRAQNVNTIDEVPDSSWFTNRIGTRPVSSDEMMKAANESTGPRPGKWMVVGSKRAGVTPGFTIEDEGGVRWFIEFDPPNYPEAPSGAEMVATKLFWALGYFQAENHIAEMRREQLVMGEKTTIRPVSGIRRRMTMNDVDDVLARAARKADGSYRVFASRMLDGKPLGGFRYYGTRPDDPNDVVPHEHRRELRALRVFGAWTNLVDMKAGNTLDVLVKQGDKAVVRHYLLDVGSTFGTGGIAAHGPDEGYAYIVDLPTTFPTLVSLGFNVRPWLTIPYEEHPAIGIFEGDRFDPETWKPRTPNPAYVRALADDNFWAARRVMAFTDDMLRAVVKAGHYSDPKAEELLSAALIKRRDKIGRTYLPAVNPLVDFALDGSGVLTFKNAAVDASVAKPAAGYRAVWARFDNATGQTSSIGGETNSPDTRVQAPSGLPTGDGEYIRVDVSATDAEHDAWKKPVHVYFRRAGGAWKWVGLERIPS